MKVIVTGGSGRAGQCLVRELAEHGHQVTNLDRKRAEGLPASTLLIDLTDAGQVYDAFAQVKPEGVCHLAANPSPGGFARQDIFQNNVLASYHVMQAAGDFGARRLIYGSSEMATGWLTPTDAVPIQLPFNEEDRIASPNAYALSKFMGEVIADSLAVRYANMAICSLRINNIIWEDGYKTITHRQRNPLASKGNFWSYIDNRDVAGAFRAALEGESSGHEVFLIAAQDTSMNVPIEDLMRDHYNGYNSFAPGYGGFQSAFDCAKIKRFFGWEARYSWRQELKD